MPWQSVVKTDPKVIRARRAISDPRESREYRANRDLSAKPAHADPRAREEMSCMPPSLEQQRYFGADPGASGNPQT